MDEINGPKILKDAEYMLFLSSDEKLVYASKGVLDNTIEGSIVITSKKIFFYYVSNISRDKVFIATYPYLKSVALKTGLTGSILIITSKSSSFRISKVKKNQAKEIYDILYRILQENK